MRRYGSRDDQWDHGSRCWGARAGMTSPPGTLKSATSLDFSACTTHSDGVSARSSCRSGCATLRPPTALGDRAPHYPQVDERCLLGTQLPAGSL